MNKLDHKNEIMAALLYRGKPQELLFRHARRVRDDVFSKRAEMRSVIEYSNMCRQSCNYCGMNRHTKLKRYVLRDDDFLRQADRLYDIGRRVIMIQTGENQAEIFFRKLYALLKILKNKYPDLTLICSFGNLAQYKYEKLRDIGIDRYLLKFETSDPQLYKRIKPSDTLRNRLTHIGTLKKLGFHVSSGNITGLPGQTLESLSEDLLLLKKLDLSMGGTSIFIPNGMSNYAHCPPGEINLALNFMAILRVMCPEMVIPTTSSMELVAKDGQYLGLMSGANAVTLHDGTPKRVEKQYVIYKQNRYKPKDILFEVIKKAGLRPSLTSLIREKRRDTVFYKLIDHNLARSSAAVYFEGREYSYRDLFVFTSKFCSFLQEKRIEEGHVVLLSAFDSIEFVVAFLSCIRLGITVALVDPQSSKEELELIVSELRPERILATGGIIEKFKNKKSLKIADDSSTDYFFSFIEKYPESGKFPGVDRNNLAMILYTSGTSGKPKGVIHTYRDLSVDNFARSVLQITAKDVVYSCSRVHTSFGLGHAIVAPFLSGAGVILSRGIPNPFSIRGILKLRPTLFLAVPSMYGFLLNQAGTLKKAFKSVRLFVVTGERLYSSVFRRWKLVYKRNLLECYGSSEMFHSFISNVPGKEKINSCGSLVEGFKIKFDKVGRISYKGPSLFKGYYGDRKLTQEKMCDGWFESDDIGYADKDGYVFIKGRSNLVFKLNGKWVSIPDIEDKLKKCVLINDVVVVKKEKCLDYYVSLNRGAEKSSAGQEIRRYCFRHLKIREFPRSIYFVGKIPRVKNGKIERRV